MNRGVNFFLALLAVVLPLAGCGGGGGSKKHSGTGVLSIFLSGDAGTAAGPTGTFHHVVVYRNDGTIVDERTVDLSSGTRQVDLTHLPAGTLRLHLGLSTTAGGLEVGSVDTTFAGGTAATPISVVMKQPVASVAVTPSTATVKADLTQQLYPAAMASDGSYVYTAPSAWSWTTDNAGFATVDSNGLVTGVAAGSATITLKHLASNFTATSTIGVTSDVITHGKWTVLVFINAANNLYQEGEDNVNQMERIANNPDVRFVVQWKQAAVSGKANNSNWVGTRRYLASYDTTSLGRIDNPIKSTLIQDMGTSVDMGSGDTLANFVAWGKEKYPADHYALVVWDHGNGWFARTLSTHSPRAISQDDQSGNFMTMPDVRAALAGQHVDILAFDACLMQGAEDYLELADKADYIVGSEENTPGPGYPYHMVFKPFVDTPDAAPSELSKSLVTEFQTFYASDSFWRTQPLHQSVLDTSKAEAFRTALDAFSLSLINDAATVGPVITATRAASTRMPADDGTYKYYDLDQICEQFASRGVGAPVIAANNLRTAIANMTVISQGNSHGTFMKGLSIEFNVSSRINGSYGQGYGDLRIASLTHWDEFLANSTANPG